MEVDEDLLLFSLRREQKTLDNNIKVSKLQRESEIMQATKNTVKRRLTLMEEERLEKRILITNIKLGIGGMYRLAKAEKKEKTMSLKEQMQHVLEFIEDKEEVNGKLKKLEDPKFYNLPQSF